MGASDAMPTPTPACLGILLVCLSNPCLAATIRVPSEQPTILAGMTLANPGDTVLVAPGVYSGDGNRWLNFEGHEGVDGNFSAAPLFCDLASGDLTLESSSPCLPGHHPGGSDCGE